MSSSQSSATIPSLTEQYQQLDRALASAKSLMLSAHVGPDGDTLGSMLGLLHTLPQRFPNIQRIDCLVAGKLPSVYNYMPGLEHIRDFERTPTSELLTTYDVAICVDCGAIDRLGPVRQLYEQATINVNIDHHQSNLRFGTINLVVDTAAASAQVVADLLAAWDISLNEQAATCLYTGLITDTGGFKYQNTTVAVFQLAARLVAAGANPERIYKMIYEVRPYGQAKLHADAMLNLNWSDDHKVAWTIMPRAHVQALGCDDEHLEGLVESIRQIDSVVLSALFKETKSGTTRISLRSDDQNLNVAALLEPLGGGGHKMAAGCTLEFPFQKGIDLVVPKLLAAVAALKN